MNATFLLLAGLSLSQNAIKDSSDDINNHSTEYYQREYTPYESAVAFLRRQLKRSDRVQLSFVINGVYNYDAALTIKKEIELWKKNFFDITLTQIEEKDAVTQFRVSGLSKPIKLPSEKKFYDTTGRLWSIASHFGGRLDICSFRMVD